jgi:hypothetical protein
MSQVEEQEIKQAVNDWYKGIMEAVKDSTGTSFDKFAVDHFTADFTSIRPSGNPADAALFREMAVR